MQVEGPACTRTDAEKRAGRPRGCLGAFGILSLCGGGVLALLGAFLIWDGVAEEKRARAEIDRIGYENALAGLRAIEGGPWPFVEEFQRSKRIAERTLENTPDPPRSRVHGILRTYERRDRPTGCAPLYGLGGAIESGLGMVVLFAGLLGLVVGLVLTLTLRSA